ncbi:MAG: VRR-NUC domain-containing protein [Acutalibacteraceae bacterium]|nr:VRR-NUC domain-containing protein [Acutalibacteraceae bacterium]
MARNVRIDYESGAQETLFNWIEWQLEKYPELELAFHIPNGGKRNAREAANLKRQGVKAGVPDICLPVARGGYHGLYIELKVGNNKPTEKQKEWQKKLNKQGYLSVVCYGWQQAVRTLTEYLEMGTLKKDKREFALNLEEGVMMPLA